MRLACRACGGTKDNRRAPAAGWLSGRPAAGNVVRPCCGTLASRRHLLAVRRLATPGKPAPAPQQPAAPAGRSVAGPAACLRTDFRETCRAVLTQSVWDGGDGSGDMLKRFGLLGLIYIIVGLVVAWQRNYITVHVLKLVLSAVLAVFLWWLPLLGVSLHIH
jgi:hypothetical protein